MEPQNSPLSAKQITLGVAILVAGIIVGAAASFYFYSASSYQAGFNAARSLVEQSSLGGFFRTPTDARTLQGTVTALSGDRLTVRTHSSNPFDDPSLSDRTIFINASTTVIKVVQKDAKVFQAEMLNFLKASEGTATNSRILPVAFITTVANVSDIKVGDSVNVLASEDINSLSEFTARGIQILPKTRALP